MKKLLLLIILLPFFNLSSGQAIHIKASDSTICIGTRVVFTVTNIGISSWHFKWQLNGHNVGSDTSIYKTDTLHNGDTVRCKRTNSTFDIVYSTSESIVMAVDTIIPNAGVITGTDSVLCEGTTIILSDTTPGGVWAVANNHASVANGIVTGISATHFECPSDALDTVYYIVSIASCNDTAFHRIRIKPQPFAGFSLYQDYTCNYAGWQSLAASYCCSYTFFVQTETGKNYTRGDLYGVTNNYCGTDTFKYSRKVTYYEYMKDTPIIFVTSTEVCMGNKMKLSAPIGNYRHNWRLTNSNVALFNDSTGLYVYTQKVGLDTITLQYADVCGESRVKPDSVIIKINPTPARNAVLSSLCIGKVDVLTDSIHGGTWSSSNPDAATVDLLTGTIGGISDGRATITYMLPTGCYGTRKFAIGDCGKEVTIFPNPSRNEITIQQVPAYYHTCTIMDITGATAFTRRINGMYSVIDIQTLARGVYFMWLTGEKGTATFKFIKE